MHDIIFFAVYSTFYCTHFLTNYCIGYTIMLDSFALKQMGIKDYQIRRPESFQGCSKDLLHMDVVSDSPAFVFVYDSMLAKQYLYNVFAYLDKIGFHVYWYGHDILPEDQAKLVYLGSPNATLNNGEKINIVLYPELAGKKALWKQLTPLANRLMKVKTNYSSRVTPKFIILDEPDVTGDKLDVWFYNLAGFFSYYNIPYSWGVNDIHDGAVVIGRDNDANNVFLDREPKIIVENGTEQESKGKLFKELLERKFLAKDSNGGFKLGAYFE